MPQIFLTITLLISCTLTAQAQKLTLQQEIWLYRIVQKTPVLKNNWGSYMSFDKQPFTKDHYGEVSIDYDAIAYYQSYNPQSLEIDYVNIKNSSRGLIAEAAIKLTLWELNEQLKRCIYKKEPCNDSLFTQLQSALKPHIPARLNSKKRMELYTSVMHPSLPIFKKIEQLNQLKVDVEHQKQLLNTWSKTITDYSYKRSQYYFSILSDGQNLTNTTFLAAGEGSGTAGLLYEWELNPQDSTRRWYGKGIGLFTYQTRTRKDELKLRPHISKKMTIPAGKPMALHTSLWGLDSSFKPMLIVSDDTVSYHLFAISNTRNLSPDRLLSDGISHIERIEQHRFQNIEKPLLKIQSNTLLEKAYDSKNLIAGQIEELENEIDTLKKYDPDNREAIEYRLRLIDTRLSSLSKKEQRIKELEQESASDYRAIDNAEKKLQDMVKLLGPSPQQWTQEGNEYKYPSGVKFDPQTQDLIFPPHPKERELEIRLVSAGYSLGGTKKDEVQAYVSITDAVEMIKEPVARQYPVIDTTFLMHFSPDEYQKPIHIHWLDSYLSDLKTFKNIRLETGQLSLPDSLKSTDKKYNNRQREYQQPLTTNARNRAVKLQFLSKDTMLIIRALASTDLVPTRLSKAPASLRNSLKVNKHSNGNNEYLVALRACNALYYALESIGKSSANVDIDEIHHNLQLSNEQMQMIMEATKSDQQLIPGTLQTK
ncbi:hypothetical protein [Carboxylicivirga sp. RSCT41]|uniref:hypothetical protein n=1 Tax=Carboxylicivirga agarovorans TaxID=3417570 RepID=UPI003D326D9D